MKTQNKLIKKRHILIAVKSIFWFSMGAFIGLFFFISFAYIIFQNIYKDVIYPGVMVNGVNFEGKKEEDVRDFFIKKNSAFADTTFVFKSFEQTVTVSAKELDLGYNANLLAQQAYTIGRGNNSISNISLIFQAYFNGINLSPSYTYSESKLEIALAIIKRQIHKDPVDALFQFQNGRVTAFRTSENGQELDLKTLTNDLSSKILYVVISQIPQTMVITVPIKIIEPQISTDKANTLGIKELIGSGTSLFQGSIQNRIYNITLAQSRLNGILVAPNEEFSFDKALGDVSAFTGYLQAYVIQNGRTVLGDGGGVCQVSTTFFRALLNAGLPITERNAHAYRVGYYEQDSPPGFDATIYVPSVDLKFKNDTGNHILIQTEIDPVFQRLTFSLYGTKDGREVTISKPVITNQRPAPEPLYQDDPTLPKGTVKQVDFAAAGANVYFTRKVTKNNKIIISDKFVSNFKPWQAVYLRGTKE
ncbi:MAG: VanW family protein [bacterium]|nr:VanW family protein [bacterium]